MKREVTTVGRDPITKKPQTEQLSCGHVIDVRDLVKGKPERICKACGRTPQSIAASARRRRRQLLLGLLKARSEFEQHTNQP